MVYRKRRYGVKRSRRGGVRARFGGARRRNYSGLTNMAGKTAGGLVSMRRRDIRLISNVVHYFPRWTNLQDYYSLQGNTGNGTYGLNMGQTGGTTFQFANGYMYYTIPSATSNYSSIGFGPQLRGINNYSNFTNLFDKYRILGYSVSITPCFNTNAGQVETSVYNSNSNTIVAANITGSLSVPIIHSVIDGDDIVVPSATESGLNAMRQYPTYKYTRLDGNNRTWSRYVRHPCVNIAAETSTGQDLSVSKRMCWIDSAATDVQYYGLKIIIECLNNTSSTLSANFKVESKIFIQCKNPI